MNKIAGTLSSLDKVCFTIRTNSRNNHNDNRNNHSQDYDKDNATNIDIWNGHNNDSMVMTRWSWYWWKQLHSCCQKHWRLTHTHTNGERWKSSPEKAEIRAAVDLQFVVVLISITKEIKKNRATPPPGLHGALVDRGRSKFTYEAANYDFPFASGHYRVTSINPSVCGGVACELISP